MPTAAQHLAGTSGILLLSLANSLLQGVRVRAIYTVNQVPLFPPTSVIIAFFFWL